jgi:hypothetical protein
MPNRIPCPGARVVAGATACFLAATTAAAQPSASPRVDSGAVVRVTARAAGLRGRAPMTVAGVRGDTLLLRGRGQGDVAAVPLGQIEALEVRDGRRPRADGARRGALWGLAAGGVPTLALLPLAIRADQECDACFVPATAIVAVLGTGLTAVTTATGAVIGWNRPGARWAPVAPAGLRVGVAPRRGGGAVAVRLPF